MNRDADGTCREQGSRDWRMVPVAVTVWSASLTGHGLFDALTAGMSSEQTGRGSVRWPVVVLASVMTGIVVALICTMVPARRRQVWAAWTSVIGCAALVSITSTWCADLMAWQDPVSARIRDGPVSAMVDAEVIGPVMMPDIRGVDCQADVAVRTASFDGMTVRSTTTVRLYAQDAGCTVLERDARYRFVGTLESARFGMPDVWLTVSDGDTPELVSEPPWWARGRYAMQQALFRATDSLSYQGRMLVPGLTLGMLGSERYRGDGENDSIDAGYAALLEERFRQSGIMHLMAVSGGHFVLVAAMVRRWCAMMLAHRYVVAVATACAYLALASLVYPSDSVTRALIMGLLGSAATALGRRAQAMSALGWTIGIAIVVEPALSMSYGFGLSCAAVFGIVSCGPAVTQHLERLLPRPLAAAVGMTIAAQMFTLPIQILMEPAIPLMSIPANLIVAPVVGLATMAGLGALLLSWLNVGIGIILTRLAASCTKVMEICAMWLGGDERTTLPWMEGIPGALLSFIAELMIIGVVHALERLREYHASRRHSKEHMGESWQSWRHRYDLIGLWFAQTPAVFDTWPDSPAHRNPRL